MTEINQETVASHNLRATHDILQTMSASKKALEGILQDKTDIFALFVEGGDILTGNKALAILLQEETDVLSQHSLKELFTVESWQIFMNKVEVLRKHKDKKYQNFELQADGKSFKNKKGIVEPMEFLWTVSVFESVSSRRGTVFSVVGRDITDLKKFQRKLSMIFSSVPLSIFQIDKEKKVRGPYSAYTEVLFNKDDEKEVEGVPFEVFLGKAYLDMSGTQRFGVQALLESIAGEEFWFDMNKASFPREVEFIKDNGEIMWVGFSYSPIVHEGFVEEILVVAEDITERVNARKVKKSRDETEGKYAAIFLNVQEMDKKNLLVVSTDLTHQMEDAVVIMESRRKAKLITAPLHAMKGTARSAGLTVLSSVVHEAEDEVLAAINGKASDDELFVIIQRRMEQITEIHDLSLKFMKVLHADEFPKEGAGLSDDIMKKLSHAESRVHLLATEIGGELFEAYQELSQIVKLIERQKQEQGFVEISSVEQKLQMLVSTTSKQLGKNIHFTCESSDELPKVSPKKASKVSEVLLHLLNNAIDHGIELQEKRIEKGKNKDGKISVRFKKRNQDILVEVEDDGGGIDHKAIIKKALEKGVIDEAQAAALSKKKNDALRLIFAHGFSTKQGLTEVSGRGVGLDGADKAAMELSESDCGIDVKSSVGNGTVFSFVVKA